MRKLQISWEFFMCPFFRTILVIILKMQEH
nr:MAG TPA: hypothetical protein [Caudoviricetes sp.]